MIQLKIGFESEHPIPSHALTTHYHRIFILIMIGLLTGGHSPAQIQSPNAPIQTSLLLTEITANATTQVDIVIVLDNSGSMKTNDPYQEAKPEKSDSTALETIQAKPNNPSSETPAKAQGNSPQAEPPRDWKQAYLDWRWALLIFGLILVFGVWVIYRARTRSKDQVTEPEPSAINPLPKATLIDLSGQANVIRYTIHKPLVQIGRDPNNNDIVIAHDTVSSQHATIKYREDNFYLCDLRSSNGTSINGKKFSDWKRDQEVLLKHQDHIRFDSYEFEFVLDDREGIQGTRLVGDRRGTRLPDKKPSVQKKQVEAEISMTQVKQDEVPPTQIKEHEAPMTQVKQDGIDLETTVKSGMCPNHETWAASELCALCVTAYCKQCVQEKEGQWVCVNCDDEARNDESNINN